MRKDFTSVDPIAQTNGEQASKRHIMGFCNFSLVQTRLHNEQTQARNLNIELFPCRMGSELKSVLNDIHHTGWGKAWPQTTLTLSRNDILPDSDDEGIEIDNANNAEGDEEPIPDRPTFCCLRNIDLLQIAFGVPGTELSYIVILEEYEFLRQLLENSDRPFIITGHPGTGKTIFLLRLMIYRLERQLPTAVQFSSDEYFTFISSGAYVCSITGGSTDHMKMLPKGCWCLSDGNTRVMFPCAPFERQGLRPFLFTSPKPDRYKKWHTQVMADTVVTALPRTVEVAAIAKAYDLDPRGAVALVNKWGPCIRTVMCILKYPHEERNQERSVTYAAIDIYNEPSKAHNIGQLPSGQGSALLFIYPIRRKDDLDYGESKLAIPTMHLSEIFDRKCDSLSADGRMKLFEALSTHSLARAPAGWQHEKNMHMQMLTDSKYYNIFNGDNEFLIAAAPPGLVGTASALRDAVRNELQSFYWFPSLANFPGIDGILVNGKNIFLLQAKIADTHRSPDAGIRKAWKAIGAAFAECYQWQFVMVTDKRGLAEKYVRELGSHLRNVSLGQSGLKVPVWGCFLEGGEQVGSQWAASASRSSGPPHFSR